MGFFTIIRSIEALLYEIMTWLVFYPRTLLSVILHPRRIVDYSQQEQGDSEEEQYSDTLSPPLFLMLTILIAHGVELAIAPPEISEQDEGTLGAFLAGSEETLLLVRAIMFSLYPLMFAVALIKRQGLALDRKVLKAPFYAQCYLGAFFALIVSLASTVIRLNTLEALTAGLVAIGVAVVWYLAVETVWLRDNLDLGWGRSALLSLGTFLKATFFNLLIGIVFAI